MSDADEENRAEKPSCQVAVVWGNGDAGIHDVPMYWTWGGTTIVLQAVFIKNSTVVLHGLFTLLVEQQTSPVSHVREECDPEGKLHSRGANGCAVLPCLVLSGTYCITRSAKHRYQ